MKRPTRKLIAFSTAVLSMLSFAAPSAASAKYTAEVLEPCEYDELIEMNDKGILIKDGNDYTISDDTKLVVIDENGEKKLISKEEGISGIYCYVSTTMGQYNFISPTSINYSFDFFDQTYRISTENGPMIVGVGDKFAVMDADGNIVSDKYGAIYRINDDYFIVDETGYYEQNCCGLIDASGKVIVAPEEGIKGFYYCGGNFIVDTVDGCYIIDNKGEKISQDFISFYDMVPSGLSSDVSHYSYQKYRINYLIFNDLITLSVEDGKYIYDCKTGKFSEKFEDVYTYDNDVIGNILVGRKNNVYTAYTNLDEPLVSGASNFKVMWVSSEQRDYYVVEKDGMSYYYNDDFELVRSNPTHEKFVAFEGGYIAVDGTDVLIYNSDLSKSMPLELEPKIEGYDITKVNPWDYSWEVPYSYGEKPSSTALMGVDIVLSVTSNYTSDDGYSNTTTSIYKFVLDSDFVPHDVSDSARVARVGTDAVILQKEGSELEYIDFTGDTEKPVVEDWYFVRPIQTGNIDETKGYILYNTVSFVICDKDLEPVSEVITGSPVDSGYNISSSTSFIYSVLESENGEIVDKYGVVSMEKGVVVEPVNDSIDESYGGFLVKKGDMTYIVDYDGVILKELSGSYNFKLISNSFYDPNWNLTKREDGVTSTVVFNMDEKVVKYEQTGKYDEVGYFINGYAQVEVYQAEDSEDPWSSREELSGIITIDGKEVIKPTEGVSCWMDGHYGMERVPTVYLYVRNYLNKWDVTSFDMSADELDADFREAHDLPFAYRLETGNYLTEKDLLWGMYGADGNILLDMQFDNVGYFVDGLSIVSIPEYTEYSYYFNADDIGKTEGVKNKAKKRGVIDDEGHIIVEPFTSVDTNNNVVAENVNSYLLNGISQDKYGVHICKIYNGRVRYSTVRKEYAVNSMTENYGYDLAIAYGDICYVEKDGLAGIVTSSNEVLVPVEYRNVLSFNPSDMAYRFVRPEVIERLDSKFSDKINVSSTDENNIIVYVEDINKKVGAYIINVEPLEKGDLDGDGAVDSSDASTVLAEYSANQTGKGSVLTAEQRKAADVNGDGRIDSSDASIILAYYSAIMTGKHPTMEEFLAEFLTGE